MTTIALLLLLTVLTTGVVVWPVIQGVRRPWALDVPSGEEEALRQEQVSALDALRDLALDFKLGNLTVEDYRALAAPLQQRARRTLELQATRTDTQSATTFVPSAADLDAQLEAEILSLRHAVRPGKSGAGVAVVAAGNRDGSGVRFCPSCGASVASTFRFCAACGNELPTLPSVAQADHPNGHQPPHTGADGTASIRQTLAAPTASPSSPAPSAPVAQPSRSASRRWLWWVGALVAAAWVAGIVGFYLNSRASQENQTPVASLPNVAVQGLAVAGGNVFVGATDGLRISEGGRVWNAPTFEEPVKTVVALDESGLLLLTADGQHLWRSEDKGATWQEQALPPEMSLLALTSLPGNGRFLVSGTARTLYVSEDGGQSWRQQGRSLPGQVRALALGQGAIFVGTSQGVFRSEDGGASWITMNGSGNGAIATTDVRALAYDEANGIVYIGTSTGLSFMNMSAVGGWGQRPLRASVTALALDPENPAVLWVGAKDGRIFRSPDRGVSWR